MSYDISLTDPVTGETLELDTPHHMRGGTYAVGGTTEALDLANWLEAVGGGPSAKRCAALLREQHARIAELEALLSSTGFTAADMATAAAQGFRDGVASLSANAGGPQDLRPALATTFHGLSDRAYCNYIEQMRRDVCLGWEYKTKHGKFGEAELKGHTKAGELLGRHKAFAEAANALEGSAAPLAAPPTAQAEGWRLVPVDATEEMVRATDKVNFANADTDGTMHNVWNVMLAAAPTSAEGVEHE